MTVAGATAGAVLALAGAGVDALWPDAMLPLAVALGAIAAAYAVHEAGFVSLPVPGRTWQVPADWVRHGFYRSAVIFGGTVGFGVFTRIPFASLPVLFAWLFVSGNVLYGVLAGTLYGALRAASIYRGGSCATTDDMVGLNQRLAGLTPTLHELSGFALAAFGVYLLTAPFL
jgi:hypothetical protein